MDSNYNLKALELIKQGDKKIKGSFFGNIVSNKEERCESALEFYKQAATQYKLAKNWEEAANTFLKCASCAKAIKSGEQADFYLEAGNLIRKINVADAIKYMQEASEYYTSENRLENVARIKKAIAVIYEEDMEYYLAIKFYNEAADIYSGEQLQTSNYNQCKLKVAELSTISDKPTSENIVTAIKIYEEVAAKYMENKLTASSSKELFFKSLLLYLMNDDVVGCQNAFEKFTDLDPTLESSRQGKLIVGLMKNIESNNVQKFSDEWYF